MSKRPTVSMRAIVIPHVPFVYKKCRRLPLPHLDIRKVIGSLTNRLLADMGELDTRNALFATCLCRRKPFPPPDIFPANGLWTWSLPAPPKVINLRSAFLVPRL